jgi:hypothetical protein
MPYRRIAFSLVITLCLIGLAPPAAADDDIQSRIAAAGDADDYDADAVVVIDWEDVEVRPNGIGTAREHRVTKILRDGAIRGNAVQRFPFDPHTNRLELVAIRVYRDDEVIEVPADRPAKQPQTAWGIFWPTDQFLVEMPRLEIGDAVEVITEMTGFNVAYLANSGSGERNAYGAVLQPPVPGHWHDEVHFWSRLPVIEKRYTVTMPKDKPLQFEVYNGELQTAVTFDEDHLYYSFTKEDMEPVNGEPRMEPWPNVGTKLLLATLPTWEDKARWLYEVSEPHFEWDEAIEKKTHEIIDGLETDEEKYTALNHWVAENIRYAGTSRGMCEGYTIHPSIETFHDRCGVCKDKAGMLVTMLRVAGYDSFLVMTMARQRVDPVPADQFNHAVTCIRWPDGSLTLLDPTWMVKSRDNWSTLEPLQHVVYGLPEGKELSQSPYFPPEECQATWKAKSSLEVNNSLRGSLDFVAVGAPEGRLRRTLSGRHPTQRSDFFTDTFQRLSPNSRPKNISCTDPADFSEPLQITCDYDASNYVVGTNNRRFFKLPMLQTVFGDRTMYDLFGSHTNSDERKYGIALLATRLGRFEETIEVPESWKIRNLPDEIEIDGPAAALQFKIDSEPGRIHYTCDLAVKRWLIPPEEYENFREVIEKFEELAADLVVCELEDTDA